MDIWSILSNIISNSLPSVAIMITGIGSVLLSYGIGGIKVKERERRFFFWFGCVLFVFGTLLTSLVAILQIRDSYSVDILAILGIVASQMLLYASTPIFMLVLGLSGLLILGVSLLRKRQIEKGYKLRTITVLVNPQNAAIQVENIGRGNFSCIARLTSIASTNRNPEINIDTINPSGLFLRWDDGHGIAVLAENVPRTINLVYSRTGYDSSVKFLFSNNTSSNPIPLGKYSIEVSLFRVEGCKHIKMGVVEDVLHVYAHRLRDTELKWKAKNE